MADAYSIILTGMETAEEKLVSTHLSQSGHTVCTAADFSEALKKLKDQSVDFMYLWASEDAGTVEGLKTLAGTHPYIPIVVVCEKASEKFILETWRSGASDILFSPLTPQALDDSLKRSAGRSPSPKPVQKAPPSARFFYLDETGKECRIPITPPRFTLGRSSGNDLVIGQMGISRNHAEVEFRDGEYLIRDLGSKMGTFLNGAKIEEGKLQNGDRVQLGGTHGVSLSFHMGDLLQTLISRSDPKADVGLSLHGFKDVGKLFAAFRALSSVPVLDDLLALVLDTAIELTGAERGFIMLKEQNGELDFRCARNNNKNTLDGSCFQISQRVPHDVFDTGKPVIIKDLGYGTGEEGHDRTQQLGLRSISCVPLRYLTVRDSDITSTVARVETIGVLYVDSSSISARMSESRIDALETLASEAAMAIYNARLYKDSQEKRKIDEQLAIAQEIQRALLPPATKELEYVRACGLSLPCYEIGGDYFDYFDLENGHFGFALGDVAGKGMPAAILASLIQGMFAAQKIVGNSLSAIIGEVNRNLVQRGTGNRFVTFFFGIIDPDGNCTYVNAGHNPPFHLGRDGSLRELHAGGMVLGLFSEAHYETGTTKMQPGDHLVLFTDGVVEALNTEVEEFGLPRLVNLLHENARSSAPEILARLQKDVLSFSAGAPQHDDITMMVLGYREFR